ncbi:mechanosensitive ion channel family protein [Gloeothece verrucosa]|uniref:MscS Mechanosensitive ion channel n=1 Tax=Gloeothece verrucosa (strain PCC 7822) TaxID=497965 RepID=E0UI58_GLOV7|nr:mechanosensitive ion channel domain-containing protein [Gloeothece verrucosa]ADN15710.1 MscS Mechanosensitive ion channel [Gloeothece verrucosa PCC 7822]
MLSQNHLPTLSDVIIKQTLFLKRSDIQHQLLAITLSLVISWLLSKWFWRWLQKTFPQATAFIWNDARLPLGQYLAMLIEELGFPLISLIALNLSQIIFITLNYTRGLLTTAITLMCIYLFYRFFLASLYATFSMAAVREYHYRLLAPLGCIFILGTIVNLYDSVEQLAQISVLTLFNSSITLGNIFILIAGLYFWMTVVIFLEKLVHIFLGNRPQIDSGSLEASLLLIRYFLIALGIVVILGYIGVNGTALAAITGGLSVGIGFGLQQVVSNFISGFILLFEKVLKPGDIISIDNQVCEVTKLGIRATTVKMATDNSEKIIPNQKFFTSDLTTYTGSDRLVSCSIVIGVGYSSKTKQVMELLLQVADTHPQVLKNPAPLVFFVNFGDSSLNFELKIWINWLNDINTRKQIISDLCCLILETFSKHKIEIPFPQIEVHIDQIRSHANSL